MINRNTSTSSLYSSEDNPRYVAQSFRSSKRLSQNTVEVRNRWRREPKRSNAYFWRLWYPWQRGPKWLVGGVASQHFEDQFSSKSASSRDMDGRLKRASSNMQRRSKDQKMQVHRGKEDAVACAENLLGWMRERLGDGRVDVQRNKSHSPSPTQQRCCSRQDWSYKILATAAGYSCDQKKVAFEYFVIFLLSLLCLSDMLSFSFFLYTQNPETSSFT